MAWPSLFRRRPTTRVPAHLRPAGRGNRPSPAEPAEPTVCGWFESSHLLTTGLQVTEHERPEAVATLVPLRWWLAWELDAAAARPPFVR